MLKVTSKSKQHSHQDKLSSPFDTVLDTFVKTGHFTLTNEIVTIELLVYFREYLKRQPKPSSKLDYKLYLENVTFDVGDQNLSRDRLEMPIHIFLDQVFSFSTRWSVIGFDNVSILRGKDYFPLSSCFTLYFLARFAPLADGSSDFAITKALIITNVEFHSWAWIKFFVRRHIFRHLTLELLANEDEADNIMVLSQALRYAKIKVVNLGNTNITVEGYQNLYKLLKKNYFIEKMQLKKPTDPASLAILKKINELLSEDRTGKQRFDVERFNQAEFLRLFARAGNALKHETNESEISKLQNEIKFILEEKRPSSIAISRDVFPECDLIPKTQAVYYDHAEYILGRLPLFRLDLNQTVGNHNTLGYYLLEEALRSNDHFMMNCLLDNITANLFEQQSDEKPILMEIYENEGFKQAILDHIYSRKNLISMAEEILKNYSKSKKIMVELGHSLINYTKRLEKIIYSYKLSSFERLLNRLRERFELSNPSKQREREFIEIYWRIGKSLILFHNAGNVTGESISNAKSTLDEITAISENADLGWLHGSKLHDQLTDRLDLLKKAIDKDINSRGRIIKDERKSTKKTFNNGYEHLETFFTNSNPKRQNSKASKLDEIEPSTSFFARR